MGEIDIAFKQLSAQIGYSVTRMNCLFAMLAYFGKSVKKGVKLIYKCGKQRRKDLTEDFIKSSENVYLN